MDPFLEVANEVVSIDDDDDEPKAHSTTASNNCLHLKEFKCKQLFPIKVCDVDHLVCLLCYPGFEKLQDSAALQKAGRQFKGVFKADAPDQTYQKHLATHEKNKSKSKSNSNSSPEPLQPPKKQQRREGGNQMTLEAGWANLRFLI